MKTQWVQIQPHDTVSGDNLSGEYCDKLFKQSCYWFFENIMKQKGLKMFLNVVVCTLSSINKCNTKYQNINHRYQHFDLSHSLLFQASNYNNYVIQ